MSFDGNNEKQRLLSDAPSEENNRECEDLDKNSKRRDIITIVSLLAVQFLVTSGNYMLVPFLPYEGGLRGLTETQIGIIVGSYAMSKTMAAPFCDRLVCWLSLWYFYHKHVCKNHVESFLPDQGIRRIPCSDLNFCSRALQLKFKYCMSSLEKALVLVLWFFTSVTRMNTAP